MLRFFLNHNWDESFRDAGVPFVEKNIDNTIKVETEAERLGRNPYRYERGETADSGVSVFGKTKEGLRGVAVDTLLFEFATAGYLPVSCYRSPKPNGAVWLTASFSRVLKNGSVSDEALGCLARFMQASFDHVHIWSNPLQPPRHLITTGTLNAAGRKPLESDDEETPRLKFTGGLWTVQ
ncbi:MAG: hypothetical protein A2756_03625 [Candidatus Ryanbacteria bacterium RIFCSPHIGHO2_01_FULL_48_27]|uniref:Uncharacterized protein n=1 Tax=Candidatus Ryanbacteria bacterium RIFCSPHIGHO2_01_FULL_48_27 TaxID=1802115 RepID=A0A1G2G4T2_9BACT|nr:MAG: hypothetical protein A2756_03625 [Candidatus Ryanbacteria bacterium RIFCSPHIGHO2_01_FULL_48_27]